MFNVARIASRSIFNLYREQALFVNSLSKQSVIQETRTFTLGKSCLNEEGISTEVDVKDASKDRLKKIPVETSIRYIQSQAYLTTYGADPVWKHYRRNHKGPIPPKKTRKTCIRGDKISTGNPCPICRDEYLVLHPENVDLLKQFISPFTGEILSYNKTGICQKKYKELLVAVEVAKDRGLITFDVPFREYDYSDYMKS